MRTVIQSIRRLLTIRALAAAGALAVSCFVLGACVAVDAVRLDSQVAQLYQEARFSEAIPLAIRELERTEEVFGPVHPKVATSLNNLAALYLATGDYASAEPLLERAVTIQEKALGPEHPEVATSLNNLAVLHQTTGQYTRAASLHERALTIREKTFGPKHPALAQSLSNLGFLYHEIGEYTRAASLYERALAIQENALGAEHPDLAMSLNNIAGIHQDRGEYARAALLHSRALAIREKSLGPEHPTVAQSLNNLGTLHQDMGEYARAASFHERALAIREKTLGPGHPDVATSLNNLALLYQTTGDYARAAPMQERALAIQEKALGPEHPDVAMSLNNLGGLYSFRGDYARGIPLLERSLVIREKALGPAHPDVAMSLHNLAGLYHAKGEYARAAPLLERSLAINEKALGPDHPDVASQLNNLGLLYHETGEYARAAPLYERAIAIRETALGQQHPDLAMSLNNLAMLYQTTGDYARAARLHERALAIREKVLGAEHPEVATSLNNIAGLHHDVGEDARAATLWERSLLISEKALGPEHPDVALPLNNLAWLYAAMGEYSRAAPLWERSLAIREKALGPEHPLVAVTLNNLGGLHWARGDLPRALEAVLRAMQIEERNIGLMLAGASEEQARAYLATVAWSTDALLSLQRASPMDPATARAGAETVLRRKGRILDAVAGSLVALRRGLAPEERRLLEQLLSRRAQLARLVLRGPGEQSPEAHRAALAALRDQVDEAERAALRRGGALRGAVAPVLLEEVQARIPKAAALLELIAYREVGPSPAEGESASGNARYGAYLLRRSGAPVWADLGEASRIEAQVQAFRTALRTESEGGRAKLRAIGADVRTTGRALYDMVLAPLAPQLQDVRFLLLAPDGVLNLIPFAALRDAEDRYLVERFALTHLTSGRDLLRLGEADAPRSAPVVIAAPDYGALSAEALQVAALSPQAPRSRRSRDLTPLQWEPLPGARLEGEAIEKLLGVKLLAGAEARESLLKQVHGPRLLHIATHGFFLADQEPPPAQTRGPGSLPLGGASSASFQRPPPAMGENPLLRSGLALAGANQRDEGTEDGILTALEMAGLDLSGTQLVVLSACDTGLGTVANGEGVYGLRRAVVMAGAEAQLTSLWKVSDEVTRKLMEAYYRRLIAGEGRAQALRAVQLEMLADTWLRYPYYWASFVPIGAWGELSPSGETGESSAPLAYREDVGSRRNGWVDTPHIGRLAEPRRPAVSEIDPVLVAGASSLMECRSSGLARSCESAEGEAP